MSPLPSIRSSRFHRFVAMLAVALVLMLDVLAVCPKAHEFFHHDADHEDHECVVTHFLHGSTTPLDNAPLVVQPVPRSSDKSHDFAALIAPASPAYLLPPGCGPPAV